jgi:ABC-type polysaccharide/polyol phosphate transport system ATPase subunit
MSDSKIDLEFVRVSKTYKIRDGSEGSLAGGTSLRGLWRRLTGPAQEFRALDDVSFQVSRGQTLGIIGHNGAGKSTILKMLSNITTPSAGEIRILGRIASLLEVGSGFHPELTGRENVYLSGSILGMRRAEIEKKFDAIVDFAEVQRFIDVPVKRYSSGMFVRLGFSIAAHLEADILLLDEVLAVGDAAFQERCLTRIEELRRAGVTIVFISHDLGAVQRLCERVLVMHRGKLLHDGPAMESIQVYMQSGRFQHSTKFVTEHPLPGRIKNVELLDESGRASTTFRTGAELRVRVELAIDDTIASATVGVYFYDLTRQSMCQFTTLDRTMRLDRGEYSIEFSCPELPLQSGSYTVDVGLEDTENVEAYDWQKDCASIYVERGKVTRGLFYAPHSWALTAAEPSGMRAAGIRPGEVKRG